MIYYALLAVELLILFFTSKKIIQGIFHLSKRLLRRDGIAAIPIFILFLPGVIIHEVAHFLAAELLFVKVYDFEVAPKVSGSYLQMGSVQVAESDPVRRFIIGVAPVIFGTLILAAALWIFVGAVGFSNIFASPLNILISVLVLWMCFFIPNTMFSSKKDLEGTEALLAAVAFIVIFILILSYFLKIDLLPVLSFFQADFIVDSLKTIVLMLAIPVAINILAILISGGFKIRTRGAFD